MNILVTTMTNEMGYLPEWDRKAWLADSIRWMQETYGDFYRLDAYPWVADRTIHDDGLPVEPIQERRDVFDGAQGRVTRYWRVRGDSKIGLPRKSDQKLHLELLMRTTAADGECGETQYDYHELASSIGLKPGPRAYDRIDLALDRLMRVKVIFNGRAALAEQGGLRVESDFSLVGGVGITVEGKEKFGSLYWDQAVVASLRSVVGVHRAEYSKGEDDTEAAQATLKRLLSKKF